MSAESATAGAASPVQTASADRAVPNYTASLGSGIKGLKIGIIHHFHEVDYKVSEGTQRGIDGAISALRDLGAEIRERLRSHRRRQERHRVEARQLDDLQAFERAWRLLVLIEARHR